MIEIIGERGDPRSAAPDTAGVDGIAAVFVKTPRSPGILKRLSRRIGSVSRRGSVVVGVAGLFALSLSGPGASTAFAAAESFEVAFQANNNTLYSYTSAGVGTSTTLGMLAGTSPASAQLSDGTFLSAFQTNATDLYVHKWNGTNISTTLGMESGTSPALAALPTGAAWVAAFQANNNLLYIYTSAGVATDTKLSMAPGSSPSIAVQPNGKWAVAFESNTDTLDTYDSADNSAATSDGMRPATNPSLAITAPPSSGNCAAANNCTPQTFADAVLAYPGIDGVITSSNEFAPEVWERAEGGGAGCPGQPADTAPWADSAGPAGNPINTTQPEPGSTVWNSDNVQIYANADGETCWYWGIVATADTLLNGDYANILSILDDPASSDTTQCDDLADAVGDSPWGTGNFSADC